MIVGGTPIYQRSRLSVDARHYAVKVLLRDGSRVCIRAICPDDKQRLLDAFHHLSGHSVYFRFLGSKRKLSEKELKYLTDIDYVRHMALVATLPADGDEQMIGVGRYIKLNSLGSDNRAEIALYVVDEFQERGLGTLLMTHLLPLARANGISEIEADVSGDNRLMLEVIEHSGFRVKRTVSSGVVHVSFSILET